MSNLNPRTYRVSELGPLQSNGIQWNEDVDNFDELETHHPGNNSNIRMQGGVIVGEENPKPPKAPTRAHAFIGGEYQEVMTIDVDKYHSLKPDQILLIKDLILDDPSPPKGLGSRVVDVPAPIGGYIGRVHEAQGVVDIYDRKDGDVIARIRHMSPISVKVGEEIVYGQSLGTQNRAGLSPSHGKHVHLEMDTRYYQEFENYISDLVSGRLSVQAEYRKDIQPLPVVDDGVMRLGESGERVAAVQRALVTDGYRGVGDKPIEVNGIYRPEMQGAVLAFQQDHRIPRTGDIDPATYQLALRVTLDKTLGPVERQPDLPVSDMPLFRQMHDLGRGLDSAYTPAPHRPLSKSDFEDPARTGRSRQYHDHPDHQITPAAPPLMQAQTAFEAREYRFFPRTPDDDYLDAFLDAAERGDYAARQTLTEQYSQLPHVQAQDREAREALLAEQQRLLEEQLRQEQERQRLMQQMQQEQEHSRSRGFSR